MELANTYNLPQPVVNAVSQQRRPIPGRYSVTQLIGSPLQRILKIKYWDHLVQDVSDMLWMLLGSAAHYILEKHAPEDSFAEEKFVVEYDGALISGIADLWHAGTISDYKVTSVFSFLLGEKPGWINQLNVYRLLYHIAGFETQKLVIHAILRDWVSRKASLSDYPPVPFQSVEVPLWSLDEAKAYLSERIILHRQAEEALDAPVCTAEERWRRPTKYAVIKKTAKRALKLFNTKDDAEEALGAIKSPDVYTVEYRPGEDVRCESFCTVRSVCPYRVASQVAA